MTELKLASDLEPIEEADGDTGVPVYESMISVLSDPSQLLHRAVEYNMSEQLFRLQYFYNLERANAETMPYARKT